VPSGLRGAEHLGLGAGDEEAAVDALGLQAILAEEAGFIGEGDGITTRSPAFIVRTEDGLFVTSEEHRSS
jgi:hypothetical protein